MKTLREEQNERRQKSGEWPTIESMMRDLAEEAEDPRTPEEKKKELDELIELEKKTRAQEAK